MEVILKLMPFLKMVLPIATTILAIIIAWSIIKWGRTLGTALSDLAESPASFVFGLVIVAIFLYFLFKYVMPLL